MADEAPPAPVGRDSSITVAPEKGAAAADDSDSSTDEEEMNDVMAKLLTKQGKTALGLKEEGNASFKLGTKEVSSHRDSSVPLSPSPLPLPLPFPFSRSPRNQRGALADRVTTVRRAATPRASA